MQDARQRAKDEHLNFLGQANDVHGVLNEKAMLARGCVRVDEDYFCFVHGFRIIDFRCANGLALVDVLKIECLGQGVLL